MFLLHGNKRDSVRYYRMMGTFHSALLLVPFVVEATGLADAVANETEDTHCKPLPGKGISARHRR